MHCRHRFEELGLRVVKFEVSTGSGLMANLCQNARTVFWGE
ncbi:hypothetical protein [Faecalibacterium sp. An121]|nr:hypothetical protein [Faecalibacterium sp. An121]